MKFLRALDFGRKNRIFGNAVGTINRHMDEYNLSQEEIRPGES